MKIVATRDVAEDVLDALTSAIEREFGAAPTRDTTFLLANDAPSWLRLIAEATWWQGALGAASVLFIKELIKEAAKDTWRSRAKAISVAAAAGGKVKHFAAELMSLRNRLSPNTQLLLATPVPSEHFGTQLTLSSQDEYVLQLEVALFIHHLSGVTDLMREQDLSANPPATGLFLELLPSGDLQVKWFDGTSLAEHVHVLSLRARET